MNHITALPKPDATELRKILDTIKRTMPEELELRAVLAQMDFAKFNAYIQAGFKEHQALELLKAEKIKASV